MKRELAQHSELLFKTNALDHTNCIMVKIGNQKVFSLSRNAYYKSDQYTIRKLLRTTVYPSIEMYNISSITCFPTPTVLLRARRRLLSVCLMTERMLTPGVPERLIDEKQKAKEESLKNEAFY
jgi:hypothetical protein